MAKFRVKATDDGYIVQRKNSWWMVLTRSCPRWVRVSGGYTSWYWAENARIQFELTYGESAYD